MYGFFAELSGGSQVSGDITARDARFYLSGGSQVNLKGAAGDLDIQSSAACPSIIKAVDVPCCRMQQLTVKLVISMS